MVNEFSAKVGETAIINDALYRYEWVGGHFYKWTYIISKEDFITCYNAWIKGVKEE